jgi:hypothetical protein
MNSEPSFKRGPTIEIIAQASEAEIRRNSKIWDEVRLIERWIAKKPQLADEVMVAYLNELKAKIGLK